MSSFASNFNYVDLLLILIQVLLTVVRANQPVGIELEFLEREFLSDISVDILVHGNDYRMHSMVININRYSTMPEAQYLIRILPVNGFAEKAFDDFHPSILYIHPNSTEECFDFMSQMNQLRINIKTLGSWKVWKPKIYVKWPNPISDESTLKKIIGVLYNFPIDWQIFLILQKKEADKPNPTLLEFYYVNNMPFLEKVDFKIAEPLSKRRANLHGQPIRATAVNDPDNLSMVSYRRRIPSGDLEFDGGSSVSLLNDLRDTLNFTIKTMECDGYISQLSRGSVGGIGAQLVNKEADLAIPLSYILPYRQKALTALHPVSVDRFLVFFRQPPASTVRYIFTQPFSPGLWLCLTLIWFLIQLSILTFNHFYMKEWNHGEIPTWDSSMLFVIAMISQQGLCGNSFEANHESLTTDRQMSLELRIMTCVCWHENPSRFSGKVVFICGLFTGLLPFLVYSASIASILSLTVVPIRNFEDLRHHKFVILADPLIDFGAYLTLDDKESSTNSENVRKVYQGGHAFINTLDLFSPVSRSLNYSDTDICEKVSWIGLPCVSLAMAYFVPKDSAYREIFNTKILLTLERGLIRRYIRTLNTETQARCDQQQSNHEQLGLRDTFTAFTLLACSFVMSFGLLILERVTVSRRQMKEFQFKMQLLLN